MPKQNIALISRGEALGSDIVAHVWNRTRALCLVSEVNNAGANDEYCRMMTFKGMLFRAWDFVYFICGDGSWRLRPHEQLVVDAAVEGLPADVRKTVRMQLEQAFFVERTSDRIYVLRFYEAHDELRIADPAFDDRLVKIQLEFDGRTQNAHVTFYKGYLFSIEFKKPAKFYTRKKIAVRGVKPGKPSESYTRAIDRLEHGRSEEDEP